MAVTIQKANFWKRISAYMLDVVLTFVLSLAIMIGINSLLKIDNYLDKIDAYRIQYAQEVGVDLEISKEEYNKLSKDDQAAYEEKVKLVNEKMSKDKEVVKLNAQTMSLLLLSVSLSMFFSILLLYFFLPLLLKQGRTLGKKLFGLAVIRSNCVKISPVVLFIRSMIGLFAIETIFPFFLITIGKLGVIVFVLFMAMQIFVMIRSDTNSCVHDLLTDTVVVDMASQTIYDSNEDLLKAQKAAAMEEATASEQTSAQ